jgi:flagellar biosynthesis protein FlhB
MIMALILFNFIFSIYSIIFIFLNIIFYADFISSKFFNGVNYFEENCFEENYQNNKINGYLNYCLNNFFLFTVNIIQILLIIGFVLCNFFYFYG